MAKVHSDCHIVIGRSYYSVPNTLIGNQVEVLIHERMVEIYHDSMLVRTHVRAVRKGQWQTKMSDYPDYKAQYLLQTPEYCRKSAQRIGPNTFKAIDELFSDRPLDRLRSVQSILGLAKSVGSKRLEAACERVNYFGNLSIQFPYPSVKKKVAPLSTSPSAQICPPCRRITRRTVARPTPVPS